MKTMTCSQLGGACELAFHANSFDEMAEISKKHGIEMCKQGDENHIKVMGAMMELMKSPTVINQWFEGEKSEFENSENIQ
jgi:predicted small metal-binding protein